MSVPNDRIELYLDLLGLRTERVWARRTLLPVRLVAAVVKKFGDALMLEPAEQYHLLRNDERLSDAAPLGQIRARTTLQLRERRVAPPGTSSPKRRLVLTDLHGNRYPVSWVPGLIGRESTDPKISQVLGLAMDDRYPNISEHTSRSYLLIDQNVDGTFTVRVDGDPEDKPALLRKAAPGDGLSPVTITTTMPLEHGDELTIVNGNITLMIHIVEPAADAS